MLHGPIRSTEKRKGQGPRTSRIKEPLFQERRKAEAQEWLRVQFRLGKPTVIQANNDGFHFMFAGDQSTYFCKWKDKDLGIGLDLKAAKVH